MTHFCVVAAGFSNYKANLISSFLLILYHQELFYINGNAKGKKMKFMEIKVI